MMVKKSKRAVSVIAAVVLIMITGAATTTARADDAAPPGPGANGGPLLLFDLSTGAPTMLAASRPHSFALKEEIDSVWTSSGVGVAVSPAGTDYNVVAKLRDPATNQIVGLKVLTGTVVKSYGGSAVLLSGSATFQLSTAVKGVRASASSRHRGSKDVWFGPGTLSVNVVAFNDGTSKTIANAPVFLGAGKNLPSDGSAVFTASDSTIRFWL